jgi:hypothetical protein
MINISISGFEEIKRDLLKNQKAVEIAAQRALLKTASAIREAEAVEMQRVFDRPTRWTLGSMKVKATNNLAVRVGVLDPDGYYKRAANYLKTQIEGGARRAKASEKALQQYGLMPQGWFIVPGECAKIDAYGNVSSGQIRQILSWFGAAERWSGSTQNMTDEGRSKKRKGSKRNIGFEYFVVSPGDRRSYRSSNGKSGTHAMQPGIYQRLFMAHGSAIKPVLIYVKQARYAKRFDFEAIAHKVADAMLNAEFEAAMKIEIAR